jgi:Ca-activated chloride channel family protein
MTAQRTQLVMAGVLMAATAVAGAAARGTGGGTASPPSNGVQFAAPANGPVRFSGQLDRTSVLAGRDGLVRMELVMSATADELARRERRPTDVVIILDRSGSMANEKIEHARAAVRELIQQLTADDRFALVTYSDDAVVAIPLAPVSDTTRDGWLTQVAHIQTEGGTNMSRGLDVGLDLVDRARADGRTPHVVLISDGLANQGDATHDGLVRRAGRAARGEYMLTTVGVGLDFNEYLMNGLADAGTGNYYYLRDATELGSVFAREFDAARSTVAAGLAVQIDPAAGVRVVDAAGYPLEASGSRVVFRPGSLFAGQERRVWVTLSVPHETVGEHDLGHFSLAYHRGDVRHELSLADVPRVACVQGEDDFYRGVDVAAWGRSVVVDAYNKMQAEVAREVKEGRRDEALRRVRQFKDENAALNAKLKSAPVAEQLRSAERLEADVVGAFQGAGQEARQNELSKGFGAQALDARRAGSKK